MGRRGAGTYSRRVTRLYIWLQRHPTLVDGVLAGALVLFGLVSVRHEGLAGWWKIPRY